MRLFRIAAILILVVATASLALIAGGFNGALAQDDGTPVSEDQAAAPPPVETLADPVPTPTLTPEQPLPTPTQVAESMEATTVDPEPPANPSESDAGLAEVDQPDAATPEIVMASPLLVMEMAASEPECLPDPSQPAQVESGGFIEYQCVERFSIESANLGEGEVAINWHAKLHISDPWTIQVLPPVSEAVPDPEWTALGTHDVETGWEGNAILTGDATGRSGLVELSFRVRVHRPSCEMTVPEIEIARTATVAAGGISTDDRSDEAEPLLLAPTLADIPAPVVQFQGPLTFPMLELDATGLRGEVRTGTLSLAIEHLASSCGAWSLHLGASPMVRADGSLLGGQLIVVGVNGSPLLGGECDLAHGCDLLDVDSTADLETLELHLDIELRAPDFPHMGRFRTTITADLAPAAA